MKDSESPSSLFTDATPRRLPERRLNRVGRFVALLATLSVPLIQSVWANSELDVKNGQSNLLVAGSYNQGTAPATTSDVTFLSGTAYSPSTFTISGANTLSIGTLDDPDAAISLTIDNATASTSATLTLNGGSNTVAPSSSDLLYVASSGTLTIQNAAGTLGVTLGAAGNLDIAGSATIGSIVTMGANAITMDGGGTLFLNAANTGTGGFTIANGTVQTNNANGLGSSGNAVTIGSGASNATLTISGNITLAQTSFAIGGSGVDTITANSGLSPTVTGTVTLNNNLNVYETNTGVLTFSGLISGNSGITVGAAGANTGTVKFSDASNTFGGTLAIDSGTVQAGASGALGAAAVDLGLNSSYTATLNIVSGYTLSNGITVEAGTAGSGQRTIGNTNTGNQTAIVSGAITLNDDLTLTAILATTATLGNDRLEVGSGGITGGNNIIISNSNTAAGAVADSGAIALYGASSATGWTGNLIIQAGQGALGGSHGANAIGASNTVAVASGAIFNISDGSSISPTIDGLDNATSGGAIGGSTGGQVLNNYSSNETLTLGGNGTYTYAGTITDGTTNKTALTVALTGGGSQTLSGANTYTGATTIGNGTLNITGALGNTAVSVSGGTLSLQAANAVSQNTVTVSGTGSLTETVSDALGGSASLSVTGGTATLSQANDYSGTTGLSSGALYVDNTGALGGGALTLSGGTIDATNGAITGQSNNPAITLGSFTFGGSNNLNLGAGAVSIAGSTTTITLNGNGSTLTLGGAATNTNSSQTAGITTTVNGTGNTLAISGFNLSTSGTQAVTDTFNGSGNITINGSVTNGTAFANGLTYAGTGTLTLNGSDNYSGVTTVSAGGTLMVGNTYALGTGTIGASATITGTLDVNGYAITNSIADKAFSGGTLMNSGAAVNLTGMGNIGASATRTMYWAGTGNITFGQQWVNNGNGAGYTVIKNGSNTVTLSGAATNTFTAMTVNSGTLVLAKSSSATVFALNTGVTINSGGTVQLAGSGVNQIAGTVTLNNGGVFDLDGQSSTITGLSVTGTGISSGGALINSSASTSSTLTGVVTLTGNSSMGGSGNLTVASGIGDGGSVYGITKAGTGTLRLNGTDTYTGATSVQNGTLVVSGSLSGSASASVTSGGTLEVDGSFNNGATTALNGTGALQGTGVVGAITANGGTVAPGLNRANSISSSGTLTAAGAVSLSSTTNFNIRVGVSSTTDCDQLAVTNGASVSLNGTLNIALGGGLGTLTSGGNPYSLYYVILNGGTSTISGGFSNFTIAGNAASVASLGNGISQFNADGYTFDISYDGTSSSLSGGDDVVLELTAVPEPGTWAMMLGGMGMLAAVQRVPRRNLKIHGTL